VDEARIIPIHGGEGDDGGRRQPRRPRVPRPIVEGDASIYPFDAAAPFAPAHPDVPPEHADGWEQRAGAALRFLRRRAAGQYEVDEFGFDRELTEAVIAPLLRALYERWFRVEVSGTEHLPAEGGALLVANHGGGLWPVDAAMTALAVREHSGGRYLRMLGQELLFATPGLSTLARRAGATLACRADVDRLLAAGELVGVWPEGFRGLGKPFRRRYQLQRFEDGGFVDAALAAGVPVIPVSIVGAEEIHPILANAKPLARLLNLPYFPITPTFPALGVLGLVPLPSKWQIVFGAPMHAASTHPLADADQSPQAAAAEFTDEVRERIQTTLYRLLSQRRSVWR
jgi:1-acyl-sn-glycerol-3-phosphate acyltransferase